MGHDDVRDRVVTWKSRFFGSGWARYDLAQPGTFRLGPPKEREANLKRDYRAMRDMYLNDPTPFDEILLRVGRPGAQISTYYAEPDQRAGHFGRP